VHDDEDHWYCKVYLEQLEVDRRPGLCGKKKMKIIQQQQQHNTNILQYILLTYLLTYLLNNK